MHLLFCACGRKNTFFAGILICLLPAVASAESFFIFGVAAIIYSVALLAVVLLFAKNVLVSKFGDWGYFLFAGVLYFFARKGIKSSLPVVRAWIRKQRESYMTWKLTRAQTFRRPGSRFALIRASGSH